MGGPQRVRQFERTFRTHDPRGAGSVCEEGVLPASVQGVVVIFLDQCGGVAAADLNDIRSWAEGGASAATFIRKCSLDPPGAFGNPASIRRVTSP